MRGINTIDLLVYLTVFKVKATNSHILLNMNETVY